MRVPSSRNSVVRPALTLTMALLAAATLYTRIRTRRLGGHGDALGYRQL